MFRALAMVVAVAALSSVAMAEDLWQIGFGKVIGQRFVLTKVDGEAFTSKREVFVTFEEGKMSGMICNRFTAKLDMLVCFLRSEVASTRMACPDEALAKLENSFFQAIRGGVAMILADDVLTLRRDGHSWEFVRVGKAPAPAAETPAPTEKPAAAPEKKDAPGVAWDQLAGKTFTLVKVGGGDFKVAMGRQPFIAFGADGRVNGSACNNFNGPGELKDGILTVKNAASTMMMCVDQNLAEYERYFHKMLRNGVKVELQPDGVLVLSGDAKVLRFEQEHD